MTDPNKGAAAPPGARRARAHPDAELTEAQVDELHRALIDTRRRVVREHQDHLDRGRFTVEHVPEPEEAAALDTSQSTLLDLAENERTLLAQVDRALRKMDDGTFGVSDESGEPIGFDRLRALPWANLSVVDQEALERGARGR